MKCLNRNKLSFGEVLKKLKEAKMKEEQRIKEQNEKLIEEQESIRKSKIEDPMRVKIKQKDDEIQQGKNQLETKQKKFREDYNETLVNFQNNMNFLSIHADEIHQMFGVYAKERQNILNTMQSMKDHAMQMKQK